MLGLNFIAKTQQTDIQFNIYTSENGLSDNTITSIVQDDQGFIWIGAHDGLNRYDGGYFSTIIKSNDRQSLPNNKVTGLKNLGKNRIGIITQEGIQILHTLTRKTLNLIIPDTTAFYIYCNRGWDIEEVNGKGYLCTTHTGFYLFDYEGKITWRKDHYSKEDIGKIMRYGREIYPLPDGNKLIYHADNYNPVIFDTKQLRILEPEQSKEILAYYPPRSIPTWRSIIFRPGSWIWKTEPRHDSIIAYHPIKKIIVRSHLSIDSMAYAWPGKLYPANDTTLIQTFSNGGFIFLHVDTTTGHVTTDGHRYLSNLVCNYIFVDRNNRIWVGTENGLYVQKFLEPAIKTYSIPYTNTLSPGTFTISTVLADSLDVYAGGIKIKGLIQLNPDNLSIKNIFYTDTDKSSDWNDIFHIENNGSDSLLLCTRMGNAWLNKHNPNTGKYFTELTKQNTLVFQNSFKDSRNNTWFSNLRFQNESLVRLLSETKEFEIIPYNKAPFYFPLKTTELFTEDAFGNVWVAQNGIARFNYALQRFDTAINVFAGYRKFESQVFGMAADAHGFLWIATLQNGLLRYDIKNKIFRHYTTNDGLSSDNINALSQCIGDLLFISTRNKLNVLNVKTNEIYIYAQADGLPESSITSSFYYDKYRNVLWAGYHNKLARIPATSFTRNLPSPNLTIEFIRFENDSILYFPSDKLTLPYNNHAMQISLSTLDFDGLENNILSYRLHDNDHWRKVEHTRYIYLDNLAPGSYKLQFKLSSIANRWETQIRYLSIHIAPPFWQTSWFLALSALSLSGIIIIIYRTRIRRLKHLSSQEKLLSELELKALHAQMNPHFIFNCINSIREIMMSGNKEKAGKYLDTFARLLRDTLEQSRHSFTSLKKSLEHLEKYIQIEQLRFANFSYDLKIDPALDIQDIRIPPMLIQPFVENAIWHGLMPMKENRKLVISCYAESDKLVCTINDNGIGIKQTLSKRSGNLTHESYAMSNVEKRIKLLNEKYQLNCSFKITDKSDIPGELTSGTIAVLYFPLDID